MHRSWMNERRINEEYEQKAHALV